LHLHSASWEMTKFASERMDALALGIGIDSPLPVPVQGGEGAIDERAGSFRCEVVPGIGEMGRVGSAMGPGMGRTEGGRDLQGETDVMSACFGRVDIQTGR